MPSPRTATIVVGLLWAYWTALAGLACPYQDSVRDIAVALRIAAGEEWPATGPGLAFSAHLGPLWYYLLAPIAAASASWLPIALFIAALSALKFPLAYAFGCRIGDRRLGLLFAAALLLPGWQHLQALLVTHTSLVETMLLAAALAIRAWLLQPAPARAFTAGLTCALALHAHPTAIVLAPLAALAAWRLSARAAVMPRCLLALAVGAVLPFAPYLIAQGLAGWPDTAAMSSYATQSVGVRQIAHLPALADAALIGGPHTLFDALLVPGARPIAFALWIAVLAATALALAVAWRRAAAPARRLALHAIVAWLVVLATVAVLRERTPWYMTYVPICASAALLASAWNLIAGATPRAAGFAIAAAIAAVAGGLALDAGLWRQSGRGEFLLPGGAMHDTLVGYEAAPRVPVVGGTSLPARAAAASGAFLCAHRAAVLHASYGGYVDASGGLDATLRCGAEATASLRIGGDAALAPERHFVGLPQRLWRELGREPDMTIGPFGLAHPVAIADDGAAVSIAPPHRYPPRAAIAAGDTVFTTELDLPVQAALVTSAILGPIGPVRIEQVLADGVVQAPLATTAFVDVYACKSCTPDASVRWQVRYRAARAGLLDVLGL
jgi:hypothetical protein